MEIDKRIEQIVKSARKRLCKIKFYKALLLFLIIGLVVWGIFQTIALIVPFYSASLVGIAACMVIIVAGIIITIVRYPSMKEAALKLDSKGFNERVTTSMQLKGKQDVFSTIQKNDTIAKTNGISMRKIFPLRINKLLFLFLFLSAIFVLTTAMMPAKSKELAVENHLLAEEIKEAEEELEDVVAEIIETHDLTAEEVQKLEEMVEEGKKELKECEDANEVGKVKDRIETKMYEYIGENLTDINKREAEAISNGLEAAKNGEIKTKDQEEIAKELEELAKKNQDEALKNTAEQMQNELNENGQISDDTANQAQQQLQPYINPNGNPAQNPGGDPYQNQNGQQGGQQQGGQNGQNGQQGPDGQNGQNGGQQGQNGGQQGGQQNGGQNGQQNGGQNGQQNGGQQQGGQNGQNGQNGQQNGGQQQGQNGGQQGQYGPNGQQGQQGGQLLQRPAELLSRKVRIGYFPHVPPDILGVGLVTEAYPRSVAL